MYFRQINILLVIIVERPCIFIPHRLSPNDFQMIQTYGLSRSRQHKAVTIDGFRKHDAIYVYILITGNIALRNVRILYTGCLKKMVIELWRAIGHSIFNIQK